MDPNFPRSWLLLLFCATTAAATTRTNGLALHPSEIVDAQPEEAARLQALVAAELQKQGTTLAPEPTVQSALVTQRGGRGTCADVQDEDRVTCLARLARAVGADRSVLITAAPWAGDRVILTALVVTANGVVLQELPAFSRLRAGAKRESDEPMRAALLDFLPKLNLAPLAVAPPSEVTADPPEEPRGGFRRVLGFSLVGLGAVAAGAGAYGFVDANAAAERWDELKAAGPSAELAVQRERVRQSSRLGLIGAASGAALVGAGAWLLLTGEPDAKNEPAVTLLPSPGSITVRGRF